MKIVFLLSLPRSGSTLLQRVLASHSSVTTISEPWFLLPLVYMVRSKGIYTEYGHKVAVQALQDVFKELPEGDKDYFRGLQNFYVSVCERMTTKDTEYFLDKTPRYTLIAEDLLRIFPDAKFIVLWRNPLAVIGSIMETWGDHRWNLHHFYIDLFKGLSKLVEFSLRHKDRVYQLQYEDLVKQPETCINEILTYLELRHETHMVDNHIAVELNGRWGDTTMERSDRPISLESLYKWKKTLSNIWRKSWALRYLRWIGRERLAVMGYNLDEMVLELSQMKLGFHHFWSDLFLIPLGWLYLVLEPTLFKEKWKTWQASKEVYKHV